MPEVPETNPRVPGLIGGLDWESAALYHRVLNVRADQRREAFRARPGPGGGLPLRLDAPDPTFLASALEAGDRPLLERELGAAAARLAAAGASVLLLCSGALHVAAEAVAAAAASEGATFLDLRPALEAELRTRGLGRVLLLDGEDPAREAGAAGWTAPLARAGVDVVVPPATHRAELARIVTEELRHGRGTAESRAYLVALAEGALRRDGVEAVVLGNAPLGLFLNGHPLDRPWIDATSVHARAAIEAIYAQGASLPA